MHPCSALRICPSRADLYQCAIGYVGVYDLPLMMTKGNVAERLGWGKTYMQRAFGGSKENMIENVVPNR